MYRNAEGSIVALLFDRVFLSTGIVNNLRLDLDVAATRTFPVCDHC